MIFTTISKAVAFVIYHTLWSVAKILLFERPFSVQLLNGHIVSGVSPLNQSCTVE